MPRNYPLLTIRLPKGTNPKKVRAEFAQVAASRGYTSDYHKSTTAGSPGEFIAAINSGEVVTCPFDDDDYSRALAGLKTFVGQPWADALISAIEAAEARMIAAEVDEMEEYGGGDDFDEVKESEE